MLASQIMIQKLKNEALHVAVIKQINGGITNIWFCSEYTTFWSDNLNKVIGDGYSFKLFDILQEESKRFPDRKIPKGNARNNKLGDQGCNSDTIVGILGYKFFKKQDGDSIYDPTHVIAAALEWAGVAKNLRGYIQFHEL